MKIMLAALPPPERLVPIVGMIATSNGCTCQLHPSRCGNALLMGLPAHGCGVLLRLKKAPSGDLVTHFVLPVGSDGCRASFASREHAENIPMDTADCFIIAIVVTVLRKFSLMTTIDF